MAAQLLTGRIRLDRPTRAPSVSRVGHASEREQSGTTGAAQAASQKDAAHDTKKTIDER